ncbi:MAG: 6,7-dimethyl-8-ribityllumazine synthase [Planctomycetes bacterium]|nr:6,7-dimethyl-8-ribityllumazine synthase [Planctomycetota bacterium]
MARDAHESSTALRLERGTRIAAVVSNYHRELTDAMLASARRELLASGLAESDWLVIEAPGAFELPVLARRLALRDDVDAVLCFGVILKGETRHDEFIAHAVAYGLQDVALSTGRPVLFGVLTCETLEQARSRALPPDLGGKQDKGREVARAAVSVLLGLDRAERVGKPEPGIGFGARAPEAQR